MSFNRIICLPSIVWDHSWERQQEIIYRLSEYYKNVNIVIVHPLGLVNNNLSNFFKKLIKRYKKNNRNNFYENKKKKNMIFVKPFYFPIHYVSFFNFLNYILLKKQIGKVNDDLIWATYVNGFSFKIFKNAKFRVLDFATRRQVNEELSSKAKKLEIEAVKIADLIFVDNYNTYLDYKAYNSNIFYEPQGVNLTEFKNKGIVDEYLELKKTGKKIIGYSGNLHKYVDIILLEKIILACPNYIFLFVGRILDEKAEILKKYDNVLFTGFKPHNELYFYYNLFDVGLIPYTIEPFTTGVYPTKFLEYVACNKPVLSSKLPDLEQYNLNFLKIYNNEKDFLIKLNELLDLKINKSEMQEFCRKNTWDERFNNIISQIGDLCK